MLLSTTALAHLMPAQQGTLNVLGESVFGVVALPASAFTGVDDDGDGRLSEQEVALHEAALNTQVAARYRLFDDDSPGTLELLLVRAEHDERFETSTAGSPTLLVLLKARFPQAPRALRLETDLFGPAPETRQLTIKAIRGGEVEAAVLTPLRSGHQYFRGPWRVLGDSVTTGLEHILLGVDHLCFLLTLVVAVSGWRKWVALLTSFTLAHSLTLALGLFGGVSVPARVVEPAIAASIVLMGLLNLRQRSAAPRVIVVFACGLLHGLGFASSLAAMNVAGANRASSLLGFNLGIELGQGAFVGVLLGLGALALRWAPVRAQLAKGASVTACLVGTFWFVERVLWP